MPWRGPDYPGELPTLGWYVLDWIPENIAAPDRDEYEPLILTAEQAQFVLNFYALDPRTGKRRYRRGVISRPKGWGKSPLLGALCIVEALADVYPDGWDAGGEPVGQPWARVRTPYVQLAAVSEDQVIQNTWDPMLEMLRNGPAMDNHPGLEPLDTFVNLPRAGKIQYVTASAPSREGNKPVFAVLDQTEAWTASNGGLKLARVIRRNAAKIGGHTLEAPNAYEPGLGSVAERSHAYAKKIAEGGTRDDGLLVDHREMPAGASLVDRDSLVAGLAVAYGDSADRPGGCVIHDPPCPPGWVDLDRIAAEFWDPDNDPQDSRRYFGNQVTHATDAWLDQVQVSARQAPELLTQPVRPGDVITVGFDGSRERAHSKPDATGLVGCRVSDGHLFEIRLWEAPDGPGGDEWEVPVVEVEAEVASIFETYLVAGFFADPAKGWRSHVNSWEGKYAHLLHKAPDGRVVKARRDHPFEWWMTGGRITEIVRATKRLRDAIVGGQITVGRTSGLTRHLLNARRRSSKLGIQVAKESPESPHKIDLAVCGILAMEARDNAVALGITGEVEQEMGGYTF